MRRYRSAGERSLKSKSSLRLSQYENSANSEDDENESDSDTYETDADKMSKIIASYGIEAAVNGECDIVEKVLVKAASLVTDNSLIDGNSSLKMERFLEICNEAGHNMLHAAVIHKKPKVIETIFDHGNPLHLTNFWTKDKYGDTALTLAIRTYCMMPTHEQDYNSLDSLVTSLQTQKCPSSLKVIRILIQYGSKVNAKNSKGDTPLILATKANNYEVVKELCNNESLEVDHKNKHGKTALHYAVALNHAKIADTLVNRGGSALVADNNGYTPLHTACKYGRKKLLSDMLKRNSSDSHVNLQTNDGKTLLLVARCAVNHSKPIIDILIKKGCNLQKVDHSRNTALHLFSSEDDDEVCTTILDEAKRMKIDLLKQKNINFETPLHVAATFGHLKVCQCFMENSNVSLMKDIRGCTPIMNAIAEGHQAVVEVMLRYCSVTEIIQHQKTLLEWAIQNDHSVLVKAMHHMCNLKQSTMDKQFDVKTSDVAEKAVIVGKDKILQLLFQEGGRNKLKIEDCPKILHTSVRYGNLNCVKVIYECTEQVPVSDDINEATPLHIACQHGYIEIVKYLLGQGATPSFCCENEGLPISCAAANGHEELVRYLLDNGGLAGNFLEKYSPLLSAAIHGHERVVEILLDVDEININSKSTRGYNCLCEAIANNKRSAVLTILENKQKCKKAMKFRTNDRNNETPLRMMIQHMPELAEYALYQCCIDEKDNQITYSFEIIDDYRTSDGINCIKKFFSMNANNNGKVNLELQGRNTGYTNHTLESEDSDSIEDKNEHDCDADDKWLQPKYCKDNDVLQLMVKHRRILLLDHPVVSELLNYKWIHFALPLYIFYVTFYAIFVALLTSMVLVAPLPQGPVCSVHGCWSDWGAWDACPNSTQCNVMRTRSRSCSMPEPGLGYNKDCVGSSTESIVCTNESSLSMEPNVSDIADLTGKICEESCQHDYSSFKNMNCREKGMSDTAMIFLFVGSIFLFFIMAVLLILNVLKFLKRRLIYFQDLVTYIETVLAVSTFVFLVLHLKHRNTCFCATENAWQAAVVAVFFGWMGLLIHLTTLPWIGMIINMLLNTFYTFMKLIIIAILLCVAFAIPFYMLLAQPGRRTPFSDIGRSLLKTLVMTTGEFEFDTIFINDHDLVNDGLSLLFPTLTTILWILFIVIMPILFNNLLVGLAIGDVQKVMDDAKLTNFKLQIGIITDLQRAFPTILCKRKKLIVLKLNDTYFSWIHQFYNSSQNKLDEWKKKPAIAPFWEKQETVDTMKTNINATYKSLNQLLKEVDGPFSKKIPEAKTRRPRATIFTDTLENSESILY